MPQFQFHHFLLFVICSIFPIFTDKVLSSMKLVIPRSAGGANSVLFFLLLLWSHAARAPTLALTLSACDCNPPCGTFSAAASFTVSRSNRSNCPMGMLAHRILLKITPIFCWDSFLAPNQCTLWIVMCAVNKSDAPDISWPSL